MKAVLALILSLLLMTTLAGTAEEAEQVIEGILVGAFGEAGKAAQTCIHDGEKAFDLVEQAITLFEKGDLASIAQGLFYIGEALEEFPTVLKDCEGAEGIVDQVKKIAVEFKNPKTLVVHIGEEILFNGKSIYRDVTNTVTHFKTTQYEPAGEDIGDIINILFLKLSVQDRRQETVDFIEGFFKGALEDDSADVDDCIDDTNDIITELEKIVADFKSGITDDLEKVFLDFIDLLAEIPKSVVQCEVVPAEMEADFASWILDLQDSKIMEHRFFNAFLLKSDRIKADMKGLIEDFEAQNFKSSGFDLGDFLHILFVEVSPMSQEQSVVKQLLN